MRWFSSQSPTKVVGFPANSSIVNTDTATAWIWRSVKLSPPPTPGATRCCTKSPPQGHRALQIPGVCPGGMVTAGIDWCINSTSVRAYNVWRVFSVKIQTSNSNFRSFNSNMELFGSNIRSFNSNIQSFNANMELFDSNIRSFKPNTLLFNPKMPFFNSNIRYFKPNIPSFDSHMHFLNSNMQIPFKHSIIQSEHLIRIFNPNIQFEHSIQTFDSNIQSKHSIRTFNANIQFEHSMQTFNSNIQCKNSIRTFNANIETSFPGSSDKHSGTREHGTPENPGTQNPGTPPRKPGTDLRICL